MQSSGSIGEFGLVESSHQSPDVQELLGNGPNENPFANVLGPAPPKHSQPPQRAIRTPTYCSLWLQRFGGAGPSSSPNGYSPSGPSPSSSCTSGDWSLGSTSPDFANAADVRAGRSRGRGGGAGGDIFVSDLSMRSTRFRRMPRASGRWCMAWGDSGCGRRKPKPRILRGTGESNVSVAEGGGARGIQKSWAADWRAYQGGAFNTSGAGPCRTASASRRSRPGVGRVWLVTEDYPTLPKILPMESWAGRCCSADKSGPETNLTDADAWHYCVVYQAGECISGGTTTVGQVYMSSPVAITNVGRVFHESHGGGDSVSYRRRRSGHRAVQHDISVAAITTGGGTGG